MSYGAKIITRIISLIFTVFLATAHCGYAWAQEDSAELVIPQISEQSLQADRKEVEQNKALDADTKAASLDIFNKALGRLSDAQNARTNADIYKKQRLEAPTDIKRLEVQILETRSALEDAQTNLSQMFADLSVDEIQQRMVAKRGEIVSLRARMEELQAADKANLTRPGLARIELASIQKKIGEITEKIRVQKTENLTPLDQANNALALSVLAVRQQGKLLLDQEIISLSVNRSVLIKEIELTDLKIQLAEKNLTALQIKSGMVRSIEAEQRFKEAKSVYESLQNTHPLLATYAQENMNLALSLSKSIDLSPEDLPMHETQIRNQLDQVEVDNKVADQIISSGKVSKNFGAHLRKLRKKQPQISKIKAQIKDRSQAYEDALFQRIVNREALQSFSGTTLNVAYEKANFDTGKVPSPPLSEEYVQILRSLYEARRELLSVLASATDLKSRRLEKVNSEQTKLLEKVKSLCEILDGRLLWLPSTEPTGLKWPRKVVSGIGTVFSGAGIKIATSTFGNEINQNLFFVLFTIVIGASFIILRRRLKPVMAEMNKQVGRVQEDGYLLTPVAIIYGLLKAAPWALGLMFIAFIFAIAPHTSIGLPSIVRTFMVLSALILILTTMRAWSEKGALFDLHYRVDWELRRRLIKHIPWLLVAQFISVILIGITGNNLDYDTGVSALGVLGFLIGSIGIAVFAIKLSWQRTGVFETYSKDNVGIYLRYEKWFFIIAIAFPIGTSFLAAFGYYESARLLLSRFFISFCVLIIAYVIHGLLQRSVTIAQRKLALEEAHARRDRIVEERRAKVAAEERGEISIPKVDYDRIDLETVNRQTIQLVNAAVFIGVAVVLWTLWRNLLPALSIFNEVELYKYTSEDGQKAAAITLWNVMQALAIGLVAWLTSRNLPGFIDVFVLKRTSIAQSTRFAFTTVLGYIILTIGIVIAFNKLGTQWSQLQWIIAALGVGIGFGLQAIFANFISGLIILFERPVRIGDFITIGERSGTVTRIQIRATTLLDQDNKEILIPNQELISAHVTNWTLSNAITRLIVKVGVAYGTDTNKAHDIMLAVIKENPNVLTHPEPRALFLGFGDSSLDFELRVFLKDFAQRFIVSHELHMAVDNALKDAGIEIPFPQRDLNVKHPEQLEEALKGAQKGARKKVDEVKPKAKPKPKPKKV
ncbi:MAG: mechanosensitive ion channel domain-containing protein [Robiginitomaculum sp.]